MIQHPDHTEHCEMEAEEQREEWLEELEEIEDTREDLLDEGFVAVMLDFEEGVAPTYIPLDTAHFETIRRADDSEENIEPVSATEYSARNL